MFGGYRTSNWYISKIFRFDPNKNTWHLLGYLNVGRSVPGVIQVENDFIVFGGDGGIHKDVQTETCKFIGFLMTCIMREPRLYYNHGPELILAP